MKTTLELPDQLVEEIKLRARHEGQELTVAVVALLRKGLAADSVQAATGVDASEAMLQRRKEIADKFISGQWGVELDGFEAGQAADGEGERELEERLENVVAILIDSSLWIDFTRTRSPRSL